MGTHHPAGSAPALPLDLLAQSIPMLTRNDLEALTERLIDVLDGMDGDCDLEDATDAEDDFSLSPYAAECASGVVGCPITDPGGDEHDGREEEYELTPDYGIDQTKSLPDAMVIASDRANMREHLNRIREEACDKFIRYGKADYRLRGRA